jgi:hypothetical protein
MGQVRDYKREYAIYHGKPEQIARRSARNKSRRLLARQGLVHKGDGMDVHHKDHDTTDMRRSNLAVIPKSKNRSIK